MRAALASLSCSRSRDCRSSCRSSTPGAPTGAAWGVSAPLAVGWCRCCGCCRWCWAEAFAQLTCVLVGPTVLCSTRCAWVASTALHMQTAHCYQVWRCTNKHFHPAQAITACTARWRGSLTMCGPAWAARRQVSRWDGIDALRRSAALLLLLLDWVWCGAIGMDGKTEAGKQANQQDRTAL